MSTTLSIIAITRWYEDPAASSSDSDSTDGLSPDFVILNPLGFLYLTIYNFSLAFSPLARSQYASRHHGNYPEVSFSDLAFSLHALLISLFTVVQVVYYNLPPDTHLRLRKLLRPGDERLRERERLLPLSPPLHAIGGIDGNGKMGLGVPSSPLTPTILGVVMLTGIGISTVIATGMLIWGKNLVWLDWLYFLSSVKLAISTVKWVPQVWLNARLKSGEGFAIGGILCVSCRNSASFSPLKMVKAVVTACSSHIFAGSDRRRTLLFATRHIIRFHHT